MKIQDIAKLWHERAQIRRPDIFGADDPLRPEYATNGVILSQVDTPALGTVGDKYKRGGMAFVSVNPAGGKSDSTSTEADALLYQAFARMRDAADADYQALAFQELVRHFSSSIPEWTIWRQYIRPILSALDLDFNEVCYLYLVPFRTKKDSGSTMHKKYTVAGYEMHLKHQLDLLMPSLIVAVDRPSERHCEQWGKQRPETTKVFYFTRKRDAHAERRALLVELEKYREI